MKAQREHPARVDQAAASSGEPAEHRLLFPYAHTGEPLEKAALLRRYRKALNAAKLDTAHRFHDLRHTFGTQMAAAGIPMRTLQEWMGHRDIKTTEVYADYMPGTEDAKLVAAAFSRDVASPGATGGALLAGDR